MIRKIRGGLADWTVTDLLLRQIDFDLRGIQWQNSGGKGQKPKPIPLPDDKKKPQVDGAELAQRLRSMGLIPANAGTAPD